jgi:hypothetical protein
MKSCAHGLFNSPYGKGRGGAYMLTRIGKRQTIETLINEEALLLAKFLKDEWKTWIPRIAVL